MEFILYKETTEEDMDAMSENSKQKHLKNQRLEDSANDNMKKEAFPNWLPEFNKNMYSSVGSRNFRHLEQLLSLYTQNIVSSMAVSSIKFNDTINIKNHISNMLIFFHLYWLDIKQDIADHNLYLNRMSTLLNVYIDVELKTSGNVKDSSEIDAKILAAKILSALYVYLNNSKEHIFKVLLRIKHATKKYTKVCDHLFTKSFTNLTIKMMPITDIAYIRYLLAFKMWKKMEKDTEDKKRINKLALMLLGSYMPKLRDELSKFVPRPMDEKNETLWLLQPNCFDLKRAHEHFLLFEDKMDNSANLQCVKVINADQKCSVSQKCQTNPLFCQSNSNEPNREVKNKNYLDSLQNHNIVPNINEIKYTDQNYLQGKRTTNLKPLKKMRKKPEKTRFLGEEIGLNTIEIIDLTKDEEISPKIKRKKVKRNFKSEYLRIIKKKHKSHINTSKYSSQLIDTDIQSIYKDGKNFEDKVLLECKPISDNRVSDSTKNYTSTSHKSVSNDSSRINFQKNEPLSIIKDQSNNCPEFVKEDKMQYDYDHNLHSKTSKFVDQNIKELKVMENLSKKDKLENYRISSHVSYVTTNTVNSYNPITENKEELTSQESNAIETLPLFKMCQSNIMDEHSFKQELPTSTNCGAMQKSQNCNAMMQKCETLPVDMNDIKLYMINKLKYINDCSSQITDILKQNVCQINECPNCYTKVDCKLVSTSNDVTIKTQDTLHNILNQKENDVKSPYENTNIINMLNDRSKCIYMNHIGEHVIAAHTEKRTQCLDKSNDIYTVSTICTRDQIEPSLYNQHVDLDNMRTSDCENTAKYQNIIKTDEKKVQCLDDFSDVCTVSTAFTEDKIIGLLDDQQVLENIKMDDYKNSKYTEDIIKEQHWKKRLLHSSEFCTFDINTLEIESKEAFEIESKEASEIMKTDCTDDLERIENISFLHNIGNMEQILEDVLHQPSLMNEMNYNNSSGVSKDREKNIFSAVSNDTTLDLLPLKQSSFELDSTLQTFCNVLSDASDDQGLFFARDDRKTASPKQFEKVSRNPGISVFFLIS